MPPVPELVVLLGLSLTVVVLTVAVAPTPVLESESQAASTGRAITAMAAVRRRIEAMNRGSSGESNRAGNIEGARRRGSSSHVATTCGWVAV